MSISLQLNGVLVLAVLLLGSELSKGVDRADSASKVAVTSVNLGADSMSNESSDGGVERTFSSALPIDPCSGNGNFCPAGNGREKAYCDCFRCFNGGDCATLVTDCVINVNQGDPTLFEKYWTKNLAPTLIQSWEHTSYGAGQVGNLSGNFFSDPELEQAIRDVHTVVGNAVTEGRQLVIGAGSSQMYLAALYAMATGRGENASTPMSVVCAAPFYSLYPLQTSFLGSSLYRWAGDARSFNRSENATEKEAIASNNYVEVVTTPNNPTGEIRQPVVEGAPMATMRQVYDQAYYWPHFTPITKPADHDLMLFTLSKCTGHAGTRIGWAIVKDPEVAARMVRYIAVTTVGVSRDAQFRAVQLLKAAIMGYTGKGDAPGRAPPLWTTSGDVDGFVSALFHYGASEMAYRWKQLRSVLKDSKRITLEAGYEPSYCKFFGEMRTPTPAYAWLRCDWEGGCENFWKSHGVLTRSGVVCGAEPKYGRVSLLERRQNFDLFINRTREIVKLVG